MSSESANPVNESSSITREALELRTLQFLCQQQAAVSICREVVESLREYRFRTVHHQVLFDCLRHLPAGRPEIIASELPARLVRAGFPDFDLRIYLAGPAPDTEEIRRLCRGLLADSAGTN